MAVSGAFSSLPASIKSYEAEQQKEAKRTSVLGQEDFLKLMTSQLQHQDPMKPMDNGEFLGQMAQFSTVSGIAQMQQSIEQMAQAYNGQRIMQAATVIDKQVLVSGNSVLLDQEKGLRGALDLPTAVNQLQVAIKNGRGELIHTLDMGQKLAGMQEFAWDGTLDDGARAPADIYFLEAVGMRDGKISQQPLLVYGNVESIQLKGGGGDLLVDVAGLGSVSFSNIKRISQ